MDYNLFYCCFEQYIFKNNQSFINFYKGLITTGNLAKIDFRNTYFLHLNTQTISDLSDLCSYLFRWNIGQGDFLFL